MSITSETYGDIYGVIKVRVDLSGAQLEGPFSCENVNSESTDVTFILREGYMNPTTSQEKMWAKAVPMLYAAFLANKSVNMVADGNCFYDTPVLREYSVLG